MSRHVWISQPGFCSEQRKIMAEAGTVECWRMRLSRQGHLPVCARMSIISPEAISGSRSSSWITQGIDRAS